MKTIRVNIVSIFFIIFVGIILTACENSKKDETFDQAAEVRKEQQQKRDTLVLESYDLNLVKLDYPMIIEEETYERAWIVKMHFSSMPTYYAERIDFYLGDYRIPEYGGLKNGIYFKVYNEELLRRFNNTEFRYKLPGGNEIFGMKSRFNLPDLSTMKMMEEKAVLERKNK